MPDNWIQGAIHKPGAFKAKAQHAGMSTGAFAQKEKHASGKTGEQARLASVLMGMHKHCDGVMVEPHADGNVASPQLPYRTPLTPQEEAEFQNWVALTGDRNSPAQDKQFEANMPGSDYDARGLWKAAKQGRPDLTAASGDGTIHGTDEFKTPYHRTLSNESKYAPPGAPAWNANAQLQTQGVLADPMSQNLRRPVSNVADESQYGRNLAVQQLLAAKLMSRHADGNVATPYQAAQQPSLYERLKSILMGKQALDKASGSTPPTPPPPTSIDYVRRAAEDAGKRNEEERKRNLSAR